jgi:hypothetical protein
MELVNIYMCFFVVAQNPLLPKLRFATRVAADKLLQVLFVVGGQVIYQMLGHLERLVAVWICTFMETYRKMAAEMLLQL